MPSPFRDDRMYHLLWPKSVTPRSIDLRPPVTWEQICIRSFRFDLATSVRPAVLLESTISDEKFTKLMLWYFLLSRLCLKVCYFGPLLLSASHTKMKKFCTKNYNRFNFYTNEPTFIRITVVIVQNYGYIRVPYWYLSYKSSISVNIEKFITYTKLNIEAYSVVKNCAIYKTPSDTPTQIVLFSWI